jgi:hypothetical protein
MRGMAGMAFLVLGVLLVFAVAIHPLWKITSPTHIIVGIVGGVFVWGAFLVAIGAQAFFWAPYCLAEGFAFGFVLSWCATWLWARMRRRPPA